MRIRQHTATILCTLSILWTSAGASTTVEPRQALALWLSQQLHHPVAASQIILAPAAADLEGCSISRLRTADIGRTSLSVRCPAHALPQLVMLAISAEVLMPALSDVSPHSASLVVRAGTKLRAEWHTDSLHAEFPVVALNSGAAGAEIRVRVTHSNRIMRARIMSANAVSIVAGA